MDDAGFLAAIRQAPGDPAPRLIYADWLDERGDGRAGLIRAEERMRGHPVFGDDYWRLKPGRDRLRASAPADWLGVLGYDLPQPVFSNGWPDDWKGRWRILRAFAENWHGVALGDVGTWGPEVGEVERRIGRDLPPSLREYVTLATYPALGTKEAWRLSERTMRPIDGGASLALEDFDGNLTGVRYIDLGEPDPPITRYRIGQSGGTSRSLTAHARYILIRLPVVQASTLMVSSHPSELAHFYDRFSPMADIGADQRVHEQPGVFALVESLGYQVLMDLTVSDGHRDETVPEYAWSLCRGNGTFTGLFEIENWRWRRADRPKGE